MDNKYVKLHSLLRMFAALLAIIVFVSLFITKQVVYDDAPSEIFFDFRYYAFFGGEGYQGNVFGFIGYILVLVGGLAGLAFVFIDEMIGKDLTKYLSFGAGGLAFIGAMAILLFSPIFKGINGLPNDFHTGAGPIVFGIFALLVAGANAAAPVLQDKGL